MILTLAGVQQAALGQRSRRRLAPLLACLRRFIWRTDTRRRLQLGLTAMRASLPGWKLCASGFMSIGHVVPIPKRLVLARKHLRLSQLGQSPLAASFRCVVKSGVMCNEMANRRRAVVSEVSFNESDWRTWRGGVGAVAALLTKQLIYQRAFWWLTIWVDALRSANGHGGTMWGYSGARVYGCAYKGVCSRCRWYCYGGSRSERLANPG